MMPTIEQLQDGHEFFDQVFEKLEAGGIKLEGKEFQGCTFQGCHFSAAQLSKCKFIDCNFSSCDLSNAALKGSSFRDVIFADAKLLGINWTLAALLAHITFKRCLLNLGNFSDVDLRKAVIANCKAHDLELAHADLTQADCRGTDFKGSVFLQTNLTKADFRGAINYAIRPGDNTLTNACFAMPEASSLLYGLDIVLEE